MTTGKGLRYRRITQDDLALVVPMDHGISIGPTAGLRDVPETVRDVARGGATAVLTHKGLFPDLYEANAPVGTVLHVSAATSLNPDPNDKVPVATVEEAVRRGADAVSCHVNFGSETESAQVRRAGELSRACDRFGMPFLFMAYARGPDVADGHDPNTVAHIARAAAEIGADLVKTVYTGDPESFARVVEGCPVPILIAGGPKAQDREEVLEMVHDAIGAGAAGVSMGRNVFQADDPTRMTAALYAIIFEDATAKEAADVLRGTG